jgi:hypothetical protein
MLGFHLFSSCIWIHTTGRNLLTLTSNLTGPFTNQNVSETLAYATHCGAQLVLGIGKSILVETSQTLPQLKSLRWFTSLRQFLQSSNATITVDQDW